MCTFSYKPFPSQVCFCFPALSLLKSISPKKLLSQTRFSTNLEFSDTHLCNQYCPNRFLCSKWFLHVSLSLEKSLWCKETLGAQIWLSTSFYTREPCVFWDLEGSAKFRVCLALSLSRRTSSRLPLFLQAFLALCTFQLQKLPFKGLENRSLFKSKVSYPWKPPKSTGQLKSGNQCHFYGPRK